MSLSDSQIVADRDASWTAYDMPSVGAIQSPGVDGKGEFVSLQLSTGTQTAFVPLMGIPEKPIAAEEQTALSFEEQTALTEKQAYDQGFAQGEKDGYELGETRARKIIEKIESIFDEMGCLKSGLVREYEKDLLATIFAIAEKVVHTHLTLNETAVKDNILAALELVAEKREVTLGARMPGRVEVLSGLAAGAGPVFVAGMGLAGAQLALGRHEEGVSALERATVLAGRASFFLGWLGWGYGG